MNSQAPCSDPLWQKFKKEKPVVISGPCSAETESQLLQTAQQLKRIGKIDILRAGIWKPRTKPGTFEGVGSKGLLWLQKAKENTGLPVTVEVANAAHVEKALEYNMDCLWLGARTTVSPFAVQEIAEALRGVNLPILVKNPINPDINLWLGALERLEKVGIRQLAGIHRGFSDFGNTRFRNSPMWAIPIELKRRRPQLPLICDPSHICGRRDLLFEVAQKAINLNFNGLMIESHITPDKAWSDAQQQITPAHLTNLLKEITWRTEKAKLKAPPTALTQFREQINQIDDDLLNLLESRMKVAQKIGRYKAQNKMTVLQTSRWDEVRRKGIAKGTSLGLGKEFMEEFLKAVHLESINQQNKIIQTTEQKGEASS